MVGSQLKCQIILLLKHPLIHYWSSPLKHKIKVFHLNRLINCHAQFKGEVQ